MTKEQFDAEFKQKLNSVEAAIEKYLPPADTRPSIVHKAMRYSMEAGGKRLRPILMLAAHDMFPSDVDPLPACVAIECLHTYSLIHDDLPCMDNSDLRRGKPTCHKMFDETMALLAGDGLLTYAFWLLGEYYQNVPAISNGLVRDLAFGAGSQGMVGGQVEDVLGEREGKMTPDKLNFIHENKTAALITAAVTMGIRMAGAIGDEKLDIARKIGRNIGLAFQVIDDILDVVTVEAVEYRSGYGRPVQHEEGRGGCVDGVDAAEPHADLRHRLTGRRENLQTGDLSLEGVADIGGGTVHRDLVLDGGRRAHDRRDFPGSTVTHDYHVIQGLRVHLQQDVDSRPPVYGYNLCNIA